MTRPFPFIIFLIRKIYTLLYAMEVQNRKEVKTNMTAKRTITMGLCQGRHDLPEVDGYVFGTEVNPLDVSGLYETAYAAIPDCDQMDLYVTGLTVALGAVISVCTVRNIGLTLHHYDRSTGSYYPQTILRVERCPFCGQTIMANSYYCPVCGSN